MRKTKNDIMVELAFQLEGKIRSLNKYNFEHRSEYHSLIINRLQVMKLVEIKEEIKNGTIESKLVW